MKKFMVLFLVFVSLLAVACGGGGSSTTTPTATPTSASSVVIPLAVSISDTELTPHDFTIVMGKTYKFVFTNTGTKTRKFVANRWHMLVTADPTTATTPPAESGPFSEPVVAQGATTNCYEQSHGSTPAFKCTINIVSAG